jgi:hypothetical protein
VTLPSGYQLMRELDDLFRLKTVSDNAGCLEEYEYEGDHISAVITPAGKMQYEFEEGKLSVIIDCNQNQTLFEYDENGNLAFILDAEGFKHLFRDLL